MKRNMPIGVFDSGLGGLTVVKEIIKILPHENIIYLGDTARVPYGPRGEKVIKHFSEENTRFLIGKKVKAIVVACNTSSAIAASFLQSKFKGTPIFEVIKSASLSASITGKKIGVIGTYGTIGSRAYSKNLLKIDKNFKVYEQPCPLFVPFIEEGEIKSESLKLIVQKYLLPLKVKQIDTLILGCTHYPIIKDVISGKIGKKVKLINPGESIAKEIKEYMAAKNLLNNQKKMGKVKYFVTDLTDRFTKVAEMFLGGRIGNNLKEVTL